LHNPVHSLETGSWFKLICGASFQHLPAVRNLVLAYALAGADCIDVAADPAVVLTAKLALEKAQRLAIRGLSPNPATSPNPLLMVSLNAGEDPHFRKAIFDADACPTDCWRPCEQVCPADAIAFSATQSGVITDRCYGCGRCLPICPANHIVTQAHHPCLDEVIASVLPQVNALEIHTQVGQFSDFQVLWQQVAPFIHHLKIIAISCPDGEGVVDYLHQILDCMAPLPCPLIWQADGRPMSGDIGVGTTHAAIRFGQKLLASDLPGYIQLAGGTNWHTVEKLQTLGLLASPDLDMVPSRTAGLTGRSRYIAGVAYGSYARVLLAPILDQPKTEQSLEVGSFASPKIIHSPKNQKISPSNPRNPSQIRPFHDRDRNSSMALETIARLEERPELFEQAVFLATTLVQQLKVRSGFNRQTSDFNPIDISGSQHPR
jgi:Fe-S-cluster-containing hydrogenase component 2